MEENKNINTEKENQEAPKKKKAAIVYRPQNGGNQRPGQRGAASRPAGSRTASSATATQSSRSEGPKKHIGTITAIPNEPVKVQESAKPAEPVKSTEPVKSAEPVKTAEPVNAQNPIKPAEPAKTSEPAKPAEPSGKEPVKNREAAQTSVSAEKKDGNDTKISSERRNQNNGQGGQRRSDGEKRYEGDRRPRQDRDNANRGNGERREGGYNRGNGERREGGYNRSNGERREGGYNRGNGERREGGYNRSNGDRPQSGYNNNGYNKDNGQRSQNPNRPFAGKDGDNRRPQNGRPQGGPGNRRDGGKGGMDLTPIQTKNSDNRKANQDYKKKDKDKRFEQPKKAENTKNLNKSLKNKKQTVAETPAVVEEETIKTLILPDTLTIKELAEKMKLQPAALVKSLFMKGQIVMINSEITFEQAEEIALEFNCICEHEVKVDVIEELLKDAEDPEETLVKRPPVVCVMGHVDHGKTSLLDAIRQTNVTSKEAGGITQAIGAYDVECNGQKITFLDTPGHEAFTAMRMRGANSTDIAILVVAADDGVMPQTIEAINHAKAAGVEIIVAINKIDKPSANVDRVKQELTEYDLVPDDWGGQTTFVPVSAHTKEGIDTLLEMILLTADVMELKANPNRKARGLVIEAELDRGRGPVATVLVQKGTLHVGESIAVGSCYGKVRAMIDHTGRRVKEATPSMPVEILGLNDVPQAGDVFVCHNNEKEARSFAETFIKEHKEKLIEETKAKLTLDGLFSQIQAGKVKTLELIVKADVQGSVEAVKTSLMKLSNEEVVVKVIHGGVGAINESDVVLASASNAIIIGFNVRPEAAAKVTADREGIDIRLYNVIYQAIEDVEAAMKGMLDPVFEEKIIGHAIVRQTFKASQVGTIAGSYVTDGIITRGCSVRITREGEQIFEGPLTSLKRFKDDVKEVKEGFECGLSFEKFNDLKEEDMIEAYTMVEVARG